MSSQKSKKISIVLISAALSFLGVALLTYSATTISTSINTGGTLTVSGNSTLTGAVWASSTLQTTSAVTFYNDLTVDTSTLYIDSTNNRVGIGTTTPNWNLQIAGTRPFLTLSDTGADTDLKHWFLLSQGGNFYIGTTTDSYATTTGYQLLTILNNGKVGIGTSTPNGNLLIWGGTSGTELIIDSLGNADFNIKSGGGVSANWSLTALTTGELRIFDNLRTKEYLRIDTAGNIGIGDSGPDAFLDISSSTASALFRVDDSGDNDTSPFLINGNGNVGIGTTTPPTKLQVSSGAGATTTMSIGELGLSTSKGCVNTNTATGAPASMYIGTAGTLVVELNYCR